MEQAPTKEGTPPVTVRNFKTINDLLNNTTVKVVVENAKVLGILLPPPTTARREPRTRRRHRLPTRPRSTGSSEIVILACRPGGGDRPVRPARREPVAPPALAEGRRPRRPSPPPASPSASSSTVRRAAAADHPDHPARTGARTARPAGAGPGLALAPSPGPDPSTGSAGHRPMSDQIRVLIVDDIAGDPRPPRRSCSASRGTSRSWAGRVRRRGAGDGGPAAPGRRPDGHQHAGDGRDHHHRAADGPGADRRGRHDVRPGRGRLPPPVDAGRRPRVPGQAVQLRRADRLDPPGPPPREGEAGPDGPSRPPPRPRGGTRPRAGPGRRGLLARRAAWAGRRSR